MKKRRMLSMVLALMVVMSCFVAVNAAEVTYAEAELLAGTAKVHGFDFIAMEETALPTTLNNATATKDGGMKLTLTSDWGYANLSGFNYGLADGSALKLTFVMPDVGNLESEIINGASTERLRIYTNKGTFYCNGVGGGSLTAGNTYTAILIRSGDAISGYLKAAGDAAYTQIFTNAAAAVNASNTSNAFRVGCAGTVGDSMVFHEVTQYVSIGERATEAAILDGTALGKGYDFTAMTQEQIEAATDATSATVTKANDGVQVTLTNTDGYMKLNSGIYTFEEGSVLKVTYIQPTAGVLAMNMFDGSNRYRMHTVSNKLRFNHGNEAAYPTLVPGQEYTLMVKKSNGTFSYYLKDGEYFYKILSDIACDLTDTTTAAQFRLGAEVNGANIVFKSVEQYVTGGTKTEILGNSNAVLHQFDFDAAYDGSANGATLRNTKASADGLDFTDTTTSDYWSVNRTIPAGGVAAIRFKINNSTFYAYIGGAHGRAILGVPATGVALFNSQSFATLEQNTWYTVLIKDNGASYDVYLAQNEADGFVKKMSSIAGSDTGNVTEFVGAAGTYVDSYTLYTAGVTDAPTDAGKVLLHENTTAMTATTVFEDAGIPSGGYAEYSFTGNSITAMFVQDGTDMEITSAAASVSVTPETSSGSWQTTNVSLTHAPNVTYVYRVARSVDNKYSVWQQVAGEEGWFKLFDGVTVRDSNSTPRAVMYPGANTTVNYVKVYAPVKDGLLLVDGANTTSIVNKAMTLEYKTGLRAIVNAEKAGVLVIGLYDADNNLMSAIIENVEANDEVTKDVSGAAKARVFLWDGFETMNPMDSASAMLTVPSN